MPITFNSHTAQEAMNILRENADYIDANIMVLSQNALKVRLNEIEDAVRVIKFFAGVK